MVLELIDDIQERSKVIILLIGTVHTAVHSDEADIVFGKKHFRVKTDFQIISADTTHILCNDNADLLAPSLNPFLKIKQSVLV